MFSKKILNIVLIIFLALGFTSCSSPKAEDNKLMQEIQKKINDPKAVLGELSINEDIYLYKNYVNMIGKAVEEVENNPENLIEKEGMTQEEFDEGLIFRKEFLKLCEILSNMNENNVNAYYYGQSSVQGEAGELYFTQAVQVYEFKKLPEGLDKLDYDLVNKNSEMSQSKYILHGNYLINLLESYMEYEDEIIEILKEIDK